MRVLIVHPGPDFSVADVYRGWADALRELGCTVALYNTNDRLIFYCKALVDTGTLDRDGYPIVKQAMPLKDAIKASMQGLTHACYTFWPDVILFVSGFFLESGVFEIMRARNHKLVLLGTESPYQEEEQLERAAHMHLNLLNDPVNISEYEKLEAPVLYMPHAYRPELHYPRSGPRDPEKTADLTFIGTAFQSRIEFFGAMDFTGTDFLLGGANWNEDLPRDSPLRRYLGHTEGCVDNDQAAELYRNAKMGINIYRREAEEEHEGEGWAIGPREVEMAAIGLPFLRDSRPESDEIFWMLPSFTGPEDATALLRWWLANDDKREESARLARLAIADRTFENNAKRMLTALEKLK